MRNKLSTPGARKKLLTLSKTKKNKEIAEIFGVSQAAVSKMLIDLTGKRQRIFKPRKNKNICNIDKAIKICQNLGYDSASHYINKNGRQHFINNIKPLIQ